MKAQAAALFKFSWNGFKHRNRNFFIGRRLGITVCLFEVKLDEPNEVTYATMAAAEKDEDMYGPFDSVADMMEELNA